MKNTKRQLSDTLTELIGGLEETPSTNLVFVEEVEVQAPMVVSWQLFDGELALLASPPESIYHVGIEPAVNPMRVTATQISTEKSDPTGSVLSDATRQ